MEAGLRIDGHAFSYEEFPYLLPIYQAFPDNDHDLFRYMMVIMKAAQMGGTVVFLLWIIYLSLRRGINVGYYLPDRETTQKFSGTRFIEIVKSNPDLYSMMEDEGSKAVRRIADSWIMFMYTGMNTATRQEKTTMQTEAMPLDVLIFDEVQKMARSQIEKTQERLSASLVRATGMVSTAQWPEADIHEFFLDSNQNYWHSRCRCNSGDGIILSEEWPDCVGESDGRIFYRCPHCDTEIVDPLDGGYVAHNPSSERDGYHFAQTISKRIAPFEIWDAFKKASDMQNFQNRKLGRPWANPSEIPINEQVLKTKVYKETLDWMPKRIRRGEYYIGIDHMGNLNVVVIKEKLDGGKERMVFLDWIEHEDPFEFSGRLIKEWRPRFVGLEALPNYNEAFKLAKAFPGKVFVIEYLKASTGGEFLRWRDRTSASDPQPVRRTSDDARFKYSVGVDQYKMMAYSLGKITDGNLEMPDAKKKPFLREMFVNGLKRPVNIAALFGEHLTKVALRTVPVEGENSYETKVVKVGSKDPHFAFANFCCDVALARAYGTTRLITAESEREEAEEKTVAKPPDPYLQQIAARIPAIAQIQQQVSGDVCGACFNYKKKNETHGICQGIRWEGNKVGLKDLGCDEFSPAGEGDEDEN